MNLRLQRDVEELRAMVRNLEKQVAEIMEHQCRKKPGPKPSTNKEQANDG